MCCRLLNNWDILKSYFTFKNHRRSIKLHDEDILVLLNNNTIKAYFSKIFIKLFQCFIPIMQNFNL